MQLYGDTLGWRALSIPLRVFGVFSFVGCVKAINDAFNSLAGIWPEDALDLALEVYLSIPLRVFADRELMDVMERFNYILSIPLRVFGEEPARVGQLKRTFNSLAGICRRPCRPLS